MRAIALLLAVTLAGCSWAFVRSPRRDAPCTTSNLAPGLDVAGSAGSFLMVAPLGLASAYVDQRGTSVLTPLAVGFAVSGVLYAISAHQGYGRTRACRER